MGKLIKRPIQDKHYNMSKRKIDPVLDEYLKLRDEMLIEQVDGILEVYFSERNAKHPNYALVRKYFRKANSNLKALILFGLDQRPTSIDLLSDLAYFHEYENVLRELIARYTFACEKEDDLSKLNEIARDFYHATIPDGYDAVHALRELFSSNTQKRESIEFLIAELKDARIM
jgi:hypothetical protein